ncbi:putative membrane protein/hemerythrin superfamily protein [Catenulispora sp. EB89]|uniref:SRPBCC family protein n=1 Tax=Catenulispora sp. EB89 TaxID=3156257 RepID=UPI003513F86C
MSDVTESVDVNVPINTAYHQWTQFESFPEFMNGVESISRIDDRHSHWVTNVGGARREFDAEITEQHPDERIAWKSTDGDTSHAGVVTFHRLGDTETRVTVHLAWEPQGLVEKVGSALGMDGHQIKADTARFKKFIEQRGAETGAKTDTQTGTQTGRPGGADIVEVLLAQHEHIKETFARVQAASGDTKEQLFGELAALLHAHESGEQQVVHPVTRAAKHDGGDLVAMACIAEERQADQRIAELKKLGTGHSQFDAKLEAFHQAVLAHAAHEERDEFPRLSQLPAERRQAMANELRSVDAI